jgi:hypothetical protein
MEDPHFSFNNGGWKSSSVAALKKERIYPNQLWLSKDGKVGALVATKWRYDEIALSRVGLDYLDDAVKEHRIENAIVVSADWDDDNPDLRDVIAVRPLDDVLASLEGVPPRHGPLGPYFWMNSDLTPFVDRLPF